MHIVHIVYGEVPLDLNIELSEMFSLVNKYLEFLSDVCIDYRSWLSSFGVAREKFLVDHELLTSCAIGTYQQYIPTQST